MLIYSLISLAAVGAASTFLYFRLLRSLRGGPGPSRRFQEIEETVRSLRSSQKLRDPADALEQCARLLSEVEIGEKLRAIRETREKLAQLKMTAPARSGEGFEGSLVIPKVFRDPDPDVALARLIHEAGARSRSLGLELKLALGTTILSWSLLLIGVLIAIFAK